MIKGRLKGNERPFPGTISPINGSLFADSHRGPVLRDKGYVYVRGRHIRSLISQCLHNLAGLIMRQHNTTWCKISSRFEKEAASNEIHDPNVSVLPKFLKLNKEYGTFCSATRNILCENKPTHRKRIAHLLIFDLLLAKLSENNLFQCNRERTGIKIAIFYYVLQRGFGRAFFMAEIKFAHRNSYFSIKTAEKLMFIEQF